MKPTITALALLIALPMSAAERQPPITKFTKADAALKLVERSDTYEKGSFATWRGRLELTGKLVLEFDRAPPDEPEHDTAGVAIFEPDTRSRAKLPAATNYYALPATEVYLGKAPIEVLPALIGREKALKVILSKTPRYELPIAVMLTAYRTDVECDHRSYSMEYTSIRLLRPELVAIAQGRGIGC